MTSSTTKSLFLLTVAYFLPYVSVIGKFRKNKLISTCRGEDVGGYLHLVALFQVQELNSGKVLASVGKSLKKKTLLLKKSAAFREDAKKN
jgi:hypothetical protein